MIDPLSVVIGAAVASVPWFLFLLWSVDKAWWLGVRSHWTRRFQNCGMNCFTCDLYKKCLERWEEEDPDTLQHKDETNEPLVKKWKEEVGESE
jgi:hypothetical protein